MTIAELKLAVAKHYRIRMDELEGTSRLRYIARPRQVVMYFSRLSGYSLPRIAHAMNRDHTTIICAVRRMEKLIAENDEFGRGVVMLKLAIIPEAKLTGEMK